MKKVNATAQQKKRENGKKQMKQATTEKRQVMVEVEIPTMTVTDEGPYDRLLNKRCLVMCLNYNYDGIVDRIGGTVLELREPGIVYETGAWTQRGKWTNVQRLPTSILTISFSAIEAAFALEP